ncbi:hypothetical protein RQP46_002473 [Phenoliferia psychrophenolica]
MAPLISKKATVHRLKAYNAFSVGTGHSLDELVLSPAELEQGATSAWLWLVNLNLGAGMNTATDSVEDALEGIEGVGEIVEWLAKPYVLVQVGSDARPALEHLRARKPSSARPVLYVELARPQVVATLLATLAPSSTPISQTDEVYGLHKRWDDGLILIEDFVTEKEERMIMEGILAEDGWHADTTKRQSRHAGPVFDYSTFAANDEYYPPGTGIPPHVDTHSAFGESLYSLSLASSVSMTLVECGLPLAPSSLTNVMGDSDQYSDAPPPPRARGFALLPPELKVKIVAMVSCQEEAWSTRVRDPQKRAEHVNSLSALSCVNKELRGLTAEHQFKVLHADRASQSIARFLILPRYGHHITDLIFTHSTIESFELTLALAPQLPSLRALHLDRTSTAWFYSPSEDQDFLPPLDFAKHRREILDTFAHKIQVVTFTGSGSGEPRATLEDVNPLLRDFDNLRSLGLFDIYVAEGDSIQTARLFEWNPQLAHLSITLTSNSHWPTRHSPSSRTSPSHPPPISTLVLKGFQLESEVIEILTSCYWTLTTLSIDLDDLESPSSVRIPKPLERPPLPLLSTLSLRTRLGTNLESFLSIFLDSPLRHFSYSCTSLPSWTIQHSDAFPSFLKALGPTLRTLRIGESIPELLTSGMMGGAGGGPQAHLRDVCDPRELSGFAAMLRRQNLDTSVLGSTMLSPFHPDANKVDYYEAELDYLVETLQRTLDFAQNKLARMKVERSPGEAGWWIDRLKAFEEERFDWMD